MCFETGDLNVVCRFCIESASMHPATQNKKEVTIENDATTKCLHSLFNRTYY